MTKTLKFKVEDVLPSLQMVSSIVLQKNTMPILGNVLVRTQNKGDKAYIIFMASDGDMWLCNRIFVQETMLDDIAVCLDAKSLCASLGSLVGEEITLGVDEEKKTIKCKYSKGHFSMTYMDAEEFPQPYVNEDEVDGVFEINSKSLNEGIKRCIYAVGNDAISPIINGIHMQFLEEGGVEYAATNRKSLVMFKDNNVEKVVDKEGNLLDFTIPKKACGIITNMLSGLDEVVKVKSSKQTSTIGTKDIKLFVRMLEGNYPKYMAIVPKDNDKFAKVDREQLNQTLQRVISTGNNKEHLVLLNFNNGSVKVTCENKEYSTIGEETLPCELQGEPLDIAFNGLVFIDMLKNMDDDVINISLKEAKKPAILTQVPNDNKEYTLLLMPMRP